MFKFFQTGFTAQNFNPLFGKTTNLILLHQNCFDFSKICFVSKIQFCSHLTTQRLVIFPSSVVSKYNLFFKLIINCFVTVFKTVLGELLWCDSYKKDSCITLQIIPWNTYCLLFSRVFCEVLKWVLFLKVFLKNFWKF